MITITRRQARRLRVAFRRHPLGIAHKGLVPPLVLPPSPASASASATTSPASPSSASCRATTAPRSPSPCRSTPWPTSRARTTRPSSWRSPTPAAPSCAGTTGRSHRPGSMASPTSRACRRSRCRPRSSSRARPACSTPWPRPPRRPTRARRATPWTASSSRARQARSWRPTAGRSSSRAASASPGTATCSSAAPRCSPAAPCPRDRQAGVGRTDAHVAIRAGDWTIWLAIHADGRFPRIDQVLPADRGADTRLRLDPGDAEFLGHALGRLPGGEAPNAPVTLDLNGRVAVRARDGAEGRVTELVLGRSRLHGAPVRLNTSRHFLARRGAPRVRRGSGPRAGRPGGLPGPPQIVPLAAVVEGVGDRPGRRRHPHRVHQPRPGPRAGCQPRGGQAHEPRRTERSARGGPLRRPREQRPRRGGEGLTAAAWRH